MPPPSGSASGPSSSGPVQDGISTKFSISVGTVPGSVLIDASANAAGTDLSANATGVIVEDSLDIGLIVGCSIGGVFVLVCLISLAYFFVTKSKRGSCDDSSQRREASSALQSQQFANSVLLPPSTVGVNNRVSEYASTTISSRSSTASNIYNPAPQRPSDRYVQNAGMMTMDSAREYDSFRPNEV